MKVIVGTSPRSDMEYLMNSEIDEFFCGYIPLEWVHQFGFEVSINRRYKYQQQFVSQKLFESFIKTSVNKGKRVFVTMNEQFYTNIQFDLIRKYIQYIASLNIAGVIVADMFLLDLLGEMRFSKSIHLSGDMGIYTIESLMYILESHKNLSIQRLIFPRETRIEEMKSFINELTSRKIHLETEAFILGDPCIFNGAHCRASHGYGVDGLCYTIKYNNSSYSKMLNEHIIQGGKKCGICFIKKLQEIGINAIKIPGRGNDFQNEINQVMDVLYSRRTVNTIKEAIQDTYGKAYCNGANCYYSIKELGENM